MSGSGGTAFGVYANTCRNRFVVSDVRELVDPDAVHSLWSHKLDVQTASDTTMYVPAVSPESHN